MENIVTIIPARGGSKAISKKNIRLIDKHPLIYYQIKAALNSKYISKVYVSTDDDEISSVVSQYNNVEVIYRPAKIAGDLSKSEEALIHAVNYLEEKGQIVDIVVFLQATSPLNRSEYIDSCIEKVLSGADSVCCAIEDFGFFLNEKEVFERPMRQQKKPKIRECGNCWVTKKDVLFETQNRLAGKIDYTIINRWDALEIDEPEDIIVIKSLLEYRNRQELNNYYKSRKCESTVNYEEGYWGTTVDPDGKIRNKMTERETYLDDAKNIINYINQLQPGKVLDVGCGCGFLLSAIDNQWNKHGTEISNHSAQLALNYGDIFIGDLLDSKYEPFSFDVIILYHVIEHLTNPVEYIKKINELLKIGGKFIVSTPDFESITALRFKQNFRLLHDKTHISLFSTESLANLIKDSNFEIEKTEYPYFESKYFTEENLLRLFDTTKMSPPFYGNIVNIYSYKC